MITSEVAVFVAAYLPSEYLTIERTIKYLLNKVNNINSKNLYLIWNTREPDVKYNTLANKISLICNVIEVKGSTSKSENLNFGIDKLSLNFKYIIIYDADARPGYDSVERLYKAIILNEKYAYIQGRFTFTRGNNFFVKCYDQMDNILSNEVFSSFKRNYFKGHDAIFRVKALLDVDGFNPGALTEDSEISKRILALGYHGGYLSDHESLSESPASLKDLFQQRLRWCSGTYQINPLGIILRFLGCILWIVLYFLYFLPTLLISFLVGAFLMKFDINLTLMFLLYPIIIVLMTLNFFIKGPPKNFKPTSRDINISGKACRRIERRV